MIADIANQLALASDDSPTRTYRPRPSLAGPERCIRQLAYHALGVTPTPIPGRGLIVFDDSSWHEELTKDLLRRSVYHIHSEQMAVDIPAPGLNPLSYTCEACGRAVPPETLHGHLDWVQTDPLFRDTLVEHKALNHFGFERIEKGALPIDYLVQTCCYSAGLQRVQPGLQDAVLCIKNKNTAKYLELTLTYDARTDEATVHDLIVSCGDAPAERTALNHTLSAPVGQALAKFREVEVYRSEQRVPARPFEIGTTFPCGYCVFQGPCWEGFEREFEAMTGDVQLDEQIEELARFSLELSGHITAMEKDRDEKREAIKALLIAKAVRGGLTPSYAILRSLRQKTAWDESKIPPAVAALAKQEKPYEVLTIRKRKDVPHAVHAHQE